MLYVVIISVRSTEKLKIYEIIDFFIGPKSKVHVLCLFVFPF